MKYTKDEIFVGAISFVVTILGIIVLSFVGGILALTGIVWFLTNFEYAALIFISLALVVGAVVLLAALIYSCMLVAKNAIDKYRAKKK